jgi:sugar-specific transcriptional regulator TrmB
MNENTGRLKKAEEVAERLGISRYRVYDLTRRGVFDSFLVAITDRQYRYDPQGLEDYIRRGGKQEKQAQA